MNFHFVLNLERLDHWETWSGSPAVTSCSLHLVRVHVYGLYGSLCPLLVSLQQRTSYITVTLCHFPDVEYKIKLIK